MGTLSIIRFHITAILQKKMTKPELGYWDIRGLGQPIRFLLEYTGTEFTDTLFSVKGEAPNWDTSHWMDVKFTKGLDFPNLPYYIDGDVKLTQSHAILRYIARKNNLCGQNEKESYRCDLMSAMCMDFFTGWFKLCYGVNGPWEEAKAAYLADLPAKLKPFEDFLGDNPWFAGKNITFVDFHMYELMYQNAKLAPEVLAKCEKLSAFVKRFEDLPQIKAYMESPRYVKMPFNNRMA